MTRELTNREAALAEDVGAAWKAAGTKARETAVAYLKVGAALLELRRECRHGMFRPALRRAGVSPSQASRLMRIAESGMDPETLASRGIHAAAAELSRRAKCAHWAHLESSESEPRTAAERAAARRGKLKAAGKCSDCGADAGGRARCERCAAAVSDRRKERRRMATLGELVAPRIMEAAARGAGVTLTADEARAAAMSLKREGR